ncbi:MAG: threonine synthase [Deltaproteobacteria bacterium]|nr:threonine synthase [Deltaproteobacteria bacterium]
MEKIISKECVKCGKTFDFNKDIMTCDVCGIEGILDFNYDYDFTRDNYLKEVESSSRKDLFRFNVLLPVADTSSYTRTIVGPSPVIKSQRLSDHIGIKPIMIKDDGRLPTSSYKDRASALAISDAKHKGINLICAASTGNAAASIAGLTAPEGIQSVIFVPGSAPAAKLAQLGTYGAKVFTVDGSYDDAFTLSLQAAEMFNWYLRSTAVNPVLSEGKKTGAFELVHQLNYKNIPEVVFVSVGDGCIIGGLAKGFLDLYRSGIISTLPRVIGVQSEGSSVIHDAFHSGSENIVIKSPWTRADSISVAFPRDYIKAIRNVKSCDGTYITVSDSEIFNASFLLGSKEGIFAEPAAATSLAGVIKALEKGIISKSTDTAIFITGNGLKDVSGSSMSAPKPTQLPKSETSLKTLKNIFPLPG